MRYSNQIRTVVTSGALGLALAASLLAGPTASFAQGVVKVKQLSVTVEAQADTASRADGVDTYKVTVVNRGGGDMDQVLVHVPIAAGYSLAGASFNQEDGWVSQIGAGEATLRVERMRGLGDTAVATLRFTGPTDAASNALTQRVSATWSQDDKQRTITSNQPGVATFALTSERNAQAITFSGDAFAGNEPVNFWYTTASGESVPLVVKESQLIKEPARIRNDDGTLKYGKSLPAGEQGALRATFNISDLPAGTYTFAARGDWSGVTASAPFVVE
jgi:hypothetical protein